MTRVGAWVGVVTGSVLVGVEILGARAGGGWMAGLAIALGVVVLAGSVLTLRGVRGGQVVLIGVALVLLGAGLVVYYRTYRLWPELVLVILASVTFGLAILGLVLDRYRSPGGKGL